MPPSELCVGFYVITKKTVLAVSHNYTSKYSICSRVLLVEITYGKDIHSIPYAWSSVIIKDTNFYTYMNDQPVALLNHSHVQPSPRF